MDVSCAEEYVNRVDELRAPLSWGHEVVIPNPPLQAQPGLGREQTSNLQGRSCHSHTWLLFIGVCWSPHVASPVLSYAAGVLGAMHHGSVVHQTRADGGGDRSEGAKWRVAALEGRVPARIATAVERSPHISYVDAGRSGLCRQHPCYAEAARG